MRRVGLAPVVVVVALAVWVASLDDVHLRDMTDIGLISVLPVPLLVAVAALTGSYCVCLRQQPLRWPLLALHLFALILMLYGITAVVEKVPSFESAWRHVGVTEYILRHHSVDPTIDAYFNWPGFFIALAFVTEVGGFGSTLSLVAWTPVVLNVLYLGPLIMIFRRATADRRLSWLALWIFYLANWIGQDYLSPQGFNYFLYLTILAILLTWFPVSSAEPHPMVRLLQRCRLPSRLLDRIIRGLGPSDQPSPPLRRWQRIALALVVVTLFAASVSSHQLTPFMLLASVTALVVLNRCDFRGLPIIMAVMILLWSWFMASAYFAGHLSHVTGEVGAVEQSVGANVGSRLNGSPGHMVVVYWRSAMTATLWGLAFLGGLRRLLHRRRDVTFALLAAAPFPLLVLQPYGGEMLLRVYFFSLPFMAFFCAALFFVTPSSGKSWANTATLSLVCLALLGSFYITRYGNERMDYFTPEEVEAVEYLYEVAPPGSVLIAGTPTTPWKFQDYEKYYYRTLDNLDWQRMDPAELTLDPIVQLADDPRYRGAFLIITRGQIANDEMFGLMPIRLKELEQRLMKSPSFELIYQNRDATIFVLVADTSRGDGR